MMLRAFCFLLSAFAVSAATITFPLQALTGSRAARKIVITPANPISVGDEAITIGGPVSLAPTTNTPTCNLVSGRYVVTFEGLPGSFTLNVPAGTNTYSALDPAVSSGLATYTYTNQAPSFVAPGYGLLAATNAGTVTLRADTNTLAVRDWVADYVRTNTTAGSGQTNWPASAITNQIQPAQIGGTLTNNTTGSAAYAATAGHSTGTYFDTGSFYLYGTNEPYSASLGYSGENSRWQFQGAVNYDTSLSIADGQAITYNSEGLTYVYPNNVAAQGAIGAINAYLSSSLFVSNSIAIGAAYPHSITSTSTGLVVDASLTLGGAAPTLRLEAGGPTIESAAGVVRVTNYTSFNLMTNVTVTTNSVVISSGHASNLCITNGRVGIRKTAPTCTLDVDGDVTSATSVNAGSGFAHSWSGWTNAPRISASSPNNNIFMNASNVSFSGNVIIPTPGTITAPSASLSAGIVSTNAAVWMLNGTSSNSVAGMVVEPSFVTNFSYRAAAIDSITPLGVVLDDGVAPGQQVRICDRGWCRVMVDGQSTTNWNGSWLGVSANLAGRAKVLSAPANSTDHDRELGHGGAAQAYAASTSTTNLVWVFLHIGR